MSEITRILSQDECNIGHADYDIVVVWSVLYEWRKEAKHRRTLRQHRRDTYLTIRYVCETFRSSDIYAWDSIAEEFVLYSAYQAGHTEMSRTTFLKPGVQSGHYTVDIDGKKYEGSIKVRRRGNDKFEVTTTGLAEQGIEDLKLHGVRVRTDNGVSDRKDQVSAKALRSVPNSDKVVSKKEFAEYSAAMTGRWYNTDEKLVDWADFGKFDKSTVSYGVIVPAADGKGLSGDFFAGRGSGKWLTVWNPVTRQIQILSVLSDGTVWEEIRYKRDGKWQTEVTLNHPDGTQEKIQSELTISKDGNTHSYRGTDATDTGTYHRAAGPQSN